MSYRKRRWWRFHSVVEVTKSTPLTVICANEAISTSLTSKRSFSPSAFNLSHTPTTTHSLSTLLSASLPYSNILIAKSDTDLSS